LHLLLAHCLNNFYLVSPPVGFAWLYPPYSSEEPIPGQPTIYPALQPLVTLQCRTSHLFHLLLPLILLCTQ